MQLQEKCEQFKLFASEYAGLEIGEPVGNPEEWLSMAYQAVSMEISNRLKQEQLNTIGKEIFSLIPAKFDESQSRFATLLMDGQERQLKGNDKDFGLTEIMNEITFALSIAGNFLYMPSVAANPSDTPIREHLRQSLLESLIVPVHIIQREGKGLSGEEIKMVENWNLAFSVNQNMVLMDVSVIHDNGVARRFNSQEELFDYSRSPVWKRDLLLQQGEIPVYLDAATEDLPFTHMNPVPLYNFNNLPPEQKTLTCINPNDFRLVYQEPPHIDFAPKIQADDGGHNKMGGFFRRR